MGEVGYWKSTVEKTCKKVGFESFLGGAIGSVAVRAAWLR